MKYKENAQRELSPVYSNSTFMTAIGFEDRLVSIGPFWLGNWMN